MKQIKNLLLLLVCIAAYIALCIVNYPQAESLGALLVFMALFFPTLPVTASAELLYLAAGRRKWTEITGFVLDILGTVLMSAYWFLMVIGGGDKNKSAALAVILINAAVTAFLGLKLKFQKE